MNNTFKRVLSLCLIFIMLASAFSCAPSAKSVFKTSSNTYFDAFKADQTVGKRVEDVKYSKSGSYAISYPVTNVSALDLQIKDYCETTKQTFLNTAVSGDELYISYRAFSAAEGIFGVEMHSKTIAAGVEYLESKVFNFDKNVVDGSIFDKNLEKLVMLNVRSDLALKDGVDLEKLKTATPNSMLMAKDGVEVTLSELETVATVPYTKLRPLLPEPLKEITPTTERVVDISKKMVAITYDDGPHNTYTNKILDTLEEHNAVATFFEVGQLLGQGADTLKRAESLGCELASHTWSHKNLQTSSLDTITDQIERTDEKFKEITGKSPTLLRPPYGAVGKTLLNNSDKYLIGWSVDTEDWRYRDKDKVVASIKNAGDLDGDVILMHSLYDSTAKATAEIVPWLIEQGYELVTVSELIKYKYEDVLQSGKYYTYNYFDK